MDEVVMEIIAALASAGSGGAGSSILAEAHTHRKSEFLKDKPSTRVHAAPGGRQQFNIFGGADEAPAPAPKASSVPAAPSATEQPTFGQRVVIRNEHTGISDRPSTLVHAAPGGRQQINIFGGAEETPVAPAKAPASLTAAAAKPTELPVAGQRVEVRNEHTGISDRPSTLVHAAPGGRQQFNIFGEASPQPSAQVAAPPAAPTASTGSVPVTQMAAGQRVAVRTEHTGISERPSTLVHAAPGGNSSMAAIVGGVTAGDRIAAMKAKREASAAPPAPLAEATNNPVV